MTTRWRPRHALGVALSAALLMGAVGCGGDDSGGTSAAGGDTVKVGVLQSLTGTMAISEVAVRDAELMAIDEINAAGGVLGKKIEPIVEDGESKPEVFADKIGKLLTVDKVPVVFGGWTSASRKAMKP